MCELTTLARYSAVYGLTVDERRGMENRMCVTDLRATYERLTNFLLKFNRASENVNELRQIVPSASANSNSIVLAEA
jgi:hypothetical protein